MDFKLVLVCAMVQLVLGYEWGDDLTACSKMSPSSAWLMKQVEDGTYRLSANKMVFRPMDKVHVRVLGENNYDTTTYTGIFLMVKEAGMLGKVVGTWDEMHASKYRRLSCDGNPHAAIAEAKDQRAVRVEDDVFVWNAPNSCTQGDEYEIKATVINDNEIYYDLSLTLTCTAETTIDFKPENACALEFSAGLANTSFEDGYGGWWNDPMSSWRFTRHKGPTPSVYTGPQKAIDGEYYVYTEASYPAKEGDIAMLNAPPGIKGCYCMKVRCHSWMGKGTYMELRINGKIMWTHTPSENNWLEGWQSVNDPDDHLMQIVVHRGVDFRGDITMDDIRFFPGMCPVDFDENAPLRLPIWENIKT